MAEQTERHRLIIRQVHTQSELEEALNIRYQVFTEEQGIANELDADGNDTGSNHLIGYYDNLPVATMRISFSFQSQSKFERLAVLSPYRRVGIGTSIVKKAIELAKNKGASRILVHSQVSARSFYRHLNFKEISHEFYEAGILHIAMIYVLDDKLSV
jgi:predicted GNAT family N-acyltransferase